MATGTLAGVVSLLGDTAMALIRAHLQASGETLYPVLRIGWWRRHDVAPVLKAASCLLAASPVLDLEMFDVWPVRLAPLLGSGLVV